MTFCRKCGAERRDLAGGLCARCADPHRAQMKSLSGVMDTKSFMLPARRNIVWVWASVTLGLLLLGETVYVIFFAGR